MAGLVEQSENFLIPSNPPTMEGSASKGNLNAEKMTLILPTISNVDTDMTKLIKDEIKNSIEEPEIDSGLPHTVKVMSKHTICLPREWRQYADTLRSKLEDILLDSDMKEDLESSHAINWCRSARHLYPIKIAGDGNCLLHAVSKAMWGVHDNTLLRRLVYIALVEDDKELIRERWQRERELLDSKVPDGGVELTEEEWDREWALVVKAAEDVKKKPSAHGDELPFECLEEIHIFVLSNVLKRPVIVLADTVIRNIEGSALGLNNFPGIYLPLLWDPKDCIKSPLVLGYSMNHFTPLIGIEDPECEDMNVRSKPSVPLVNHMFESFYVHFLTEGEESKAHDLLLAHMDVTETAYTRVEDTNMILSANIEYFALSDELNVVKKFFSMCNATYTEFMAKQVKNEPTKVNCHSAGCKRYGKAELDFFCPKCYLFRESESDNGHSNGHEEKSQDKSPTEIPSTPPVQPTQTASPASINPFENPDEHLMAAGSLAASASGLPAPDSPVVSMLEEMCSFADCDNHCAQTTKPYCHEHVFLTTIRQRKPDECLYPGCHDSFTASCKPYCQTHRLPTNEDEDSNNDVEPSITESHCTEEGCHNFTSRFTHPFCHEHKPSDIGSVFCARIGCSNYQDESLKPFCERHAASGDSSYSRSSSARAESAESGAEGSATTTQNTRYEDMLPVFMAFICAIPSCDKKVSIDTDMYCREHYIEKYGEPPGRSSPARRTDDVTTTSRRMYRSSSSSDSATPSRDTPEPASTRADTQPSSLDSSLRSSTRINRCHEAGCKLPGSAAWNYYCSQHRMVNGNSSRARVSMEDSSPERAASPEAPETRISLIENRSRLSHQEPSPVAPRAERFTRQESLSPPRYSARRRGRSISSDTDSPSPPRRRYGSGYRYDSTYSSSRNEFSFPELNTSSTRETRTSSLYSSRYSSRDFGASSRVDSGTSRFSRYSRIQSPSPTRNTSAREITSATNETETSNQEDAKKEEPRKPPQMIKMTPPEKPKSRLDKTRELLRIGLCLKTGCNNSAESQYSGFCKSCAEQSQFIQIERQVESVVITENVPCISAGCRRFGSPDFGGVCHQCFSKPAQIQSPVMNGHHVESRAVGATSVNNAETRTLNECKSEACFAVASNGNQGYCGECFARMNRIGTLGSTLVVAGPPDFPPEQRNESFGGARPKERRRLKSLSLDRKRSSRAITLNEDAELVNGRPNAIGLNPSANDASLTSYEQNMKAIRRCPGADCKKVAYEAFNGMCQLCYNKASQTTARTAARIPSTKSSGSMPSPPAQPSGNECKTDGCDMYGTGAQMGFCSTCYKKHKSESGVKRKELKSKPKKSPKLTHAAEAIPCVRRGCDMYGDPGFKGMCSGCFNRASRVFKVAPRKSKVSTNCPETKQTSSESTTIDTTPDTESSAHEVNHQLYEDSLKKIEAASRSSYSRCKNAGCPNMGNSRCRGYCNTCFPFVNVKT